MLGTRTSDNSSPAPSREASDDSLLAQIATKDKRAFEIFFHRYHRRLFRFLFRLVNRSDIVEEVINDVMFTVWQQASAFRGESTVSTWLFGIAYRKGLKALQRVQRQELPAQKESIFAAPDSEATADAETLFDDAAFVEQLKRGIDLLSTEHRSVVHLTALGYSYSEIADIVDCPANTVKTRMFYARQQLRRFLSKPSSATVRRNVKQP